MIQDWFVQILSLSSYLYCKISDANQCESFSFFRKVNGRRHEFVDCYKIFFLHVLADMFVVVTTIPFRFRKITFRTRCITGRVLSWAIRSCHPVSRIYSPFWNIWDDPTIVYSFLCCFLCTFFGFLAKALLIHFILMKYRCYIFDFMEIMY